jgi:hypothetical protein
MIQSVLSVTLALLVVFMTAFYSEQTRPPQEPVIIVVTSTTTEFSLPFEPGPTSSAPTNDDTRPLRLQAPVQHLRTSLQSSW